MKKILFFFCFALVIILPSFSFAEGINTLPNFHISQKQTISIQHIIQADLFFNDDYIISEADDDINDAVRKTLSLNKAHSKTISLVVEHYSATFLNKIWSNKYLFFLHSPLFIFISVFRL